MTDPTSESNPENYGEAAQQASEPTTSEANLLVQIDRLRDEIAKLRDLLWLDLVIEWARDHKLSLHHLHSLARRIHEAIEATPAHKPGSTNGETKHD